MPRQTFQHAATTAAPIAEAWEALDRPDTWESVPGVDRVIDPIVDHDGRLRGFSFETAVAGRTYRGTATPSGREEERLIAWDIETPELTLSVMVALSELEDGTRVYVKLDLETAGLLSAVFFPAIVSAIGNSFADTVDSFASGLSG